MNLRIIVAGIIIFGIGLIWALPGIILKNAGSPTTSEGDAIKLVFNEMNNSLGNYEGISEIVNSTNKSMNTINAIPSILMLIGFLIFLAGFFIPNS